MNKYIIIFAIFLLMMFPIKKSYCIDNELNLIISSFQNYHYQFEIDDKIPEEYKKLYSSLRLYLNDLQKSENKKMGIYISFDKDSNEFKFRLFETPTQKTSSLYV